MLRGFAALENLKRYECMTERSSERDCEVMMKNIVKGKSFGTGGEDYKKKGLRVGGEEGVRDKFNESMVWWKNCMRGKCGVYHYMGRKGI